MKQLADLQGVRSTLAHKFLRPDFKTFSPLNWLCVRARNWEVSGDLLSLLEEIRESATT